MTKQSQTTQSIRKHHKHNAVTLAARRVFCLPGNGDNTFNIQTNLRGRLRTMSARHFLVQTTSHVPKLSNEHKTPLRKGSLVFNENDEYCTVVFMPKGVEGSERETSSSCLEPGSISGDKEKSVDFDIPVHDQPVSGLSNTTQSARIIIDDDDESTDADYPTYEDPISGLLDMEELDDILIKDNERLGIDNPLNDDSYLSMLNAEQASIVQKNVLQPIQPIATHPCLCVEPPKFHGRHDVMVVNGSVFKYCSKHRQFVASDKFGRSRITCDSCLAKRTSRMARRRRERDARDAVQGIVRRPNSCVVDKCENLKTVKGNIMHRHLCAKHNKLHLAGHVLLLDGEHVKYCSRNRHFVSPDNFAHSPVTCVSCLQRRNRSMLQSRHR